MSVTRADDLSAIGAHRTLGAVAIRLTGLPAVFDLVMSIPRERWRRYLWLGAAVVLGCSVARAWWIAVTAGFILPPAGVDFATYQQAAIRFLSGLSFYHPWQLQGPYDVWAGSGINDPVLYPPLAIPLFAGFVYLPTVLYWLIPLATTAYCIVRLRPRPMAVVVCLLLVAWPSSLAMLAWTGNPTIWMVAALSLAAVGSRWAAPLILIKPSLGLFAVWGFRSREWVLGTGLMILVGLAFAPLWFQYVVVLANARQAGILYSIWHVPAMMIPIVAWLGSTRRRAVLT